MEHYDLRGIRVSVQLGPCDDSDIDLVVKSQDMPVDINPLGSLNNQSAARSLGISIREASNADALHHWPSVSIQNQDRRKLVYTAAKDALNTAENAGAKSVGFFTFGLEVSRVPSWEVAEEIVRALIDHAKDGTALDRVILVASSPIQLSSFRFALNNIRILRG